MEEEMKINDKELVDIITKENEKLAKEQFLKGTIAGWNACLLTIKKEISGMTSCKKIKKHLDKKIIESQHRIKGDNNNNDRNCESEN